MKGVKGLCEAVILQSMEDLMACDAMDENREFFYGEGMAICSAVAGLDEDARDRLVSYALRAHRRTRTLRKASRPVFAGI